MSADTTHGPPPAADAPEPAPKPTPPQNHQGLLLGAPFTSDTSDTPPDTPAAGPQEASTKTETTKPTNTTPDATGDATSPDSFSWQTVGTVGAALAVTGGGVALASHGGMTLAGIVLAAVGAAVAVAVIAARYRNKKNRDNNKARDSGKTDTNNRNSAGRHNPNNGKTPHGGHRQPGMLNRMSGGRLGSRKNTGQGKGSRTGSAPARSGRSKFGMSGRKTRNSPPGTKSTAAHGVPGAGKSGKRGLRDRTKNGKTATTAAHSVGSGTRKKSTAAHGNKTGQRSRPASRSAGAASGRNHGSRNPAGATRQGGRSGSADRKRPNRKGETKDTSAVSRLLERLNRDKGNKKDPKYKNDEDLKSFEQMDSGVAKKHLRQWEKDDWESVNKKDGHEKEAEKENEQKPKESEKEPKEKEKSDEAVEEKTTETEDEEEFLFDDAGFPSYPRHDPEPPKPSGPPPGWRGPIWDNEVVTGHDYDKDPYPIRIGPVDQQEIPTGNGGNQGGTMTNANTAHRPATVGESDQSTYVDRNNRVEAGLEELRRARASKERALENMNRLEAESTGLEDLEAAGTPENFGESQNQIQKDINEIDAKIAVFSHVLGESR